MYNRQFSYWLFQRSVKERPEWEMQSGFPQDSPAPRRQHLLNDAPVVLGLKQLGLQTGDAF